MATTTTYIYTGANQYIQALIQDGLKWTSPGSTTTTINYFFQDLTPDGMGADAYAWNSLEKSAFRLALGEWSSVGNINFAEVTSLSDANFVERVGNSQYLDGDLGNHDYPRAWSYGNFNREGSGWDEADASGGLSAGGDGYYTLLHEIGHGLGLNHTFDGWEIFPGASGAGDFGDFNLDQGVYSVMSYNEGWKSNAASGTSTYGINTGLGAFDIAAIQTMYGARANNAGSNTYWLPSANVPGTGFECIWDTGGLDTIAYAGSADCTMDLSPATLDSSATGGGIVSRADGIFGGFTIAADATNFITDVSGVTGVIIENATGGSGNDTLRGNNSANRLEGGGGNDSLFAGLGVDWLLGGAGNDTLWGAGSDNLRGGADNDTYYVTSGDRVLEFASEGTDTVRTELASYTLTANVENLVFSNITEFHETDPHRGTGNVRDNNIRGAGGNDTLWGLDGSDTLIGGDGADRLYGGNHTDYLFGEAGHDGMLDGGAGNDYLYGGAGNDSLLGGTGNDFLYGGADNDTLDGGTGNDSLNGGTENDTLSGGTGNDQLSGEGGDDTLNGNNNDDDLFGGDGVDTLNGGAGNDQLWGDAGNDTLNGDSFDDELYGGAGADTLNGGAHNDKLWGGAGKDTLTGSTGNDQFIFLSTDDSNMWSGGFGDPLFGDPLFGEILIIDNVDTITDFMRGTSATTGDKIVLGAIDASPGGADDMFHFLTSPAAHAGDWTGQVWSQVTLVSGSLWTGDAVFETVVYASTDADAAGELQIRLNGSYGLTDTDFVL